MSILNKIKTLLTRKHDEFIGPPGQPFSDADLVRHCEAFGVDYEKVKARLARVGYTTAPPMFPPLVSFDDGLLASLQAHCEANRKALPNGVGISKRKRKELDRRRLECSKRKRVRSDRLRGGRV